MLIRAVRDGVPVDISSVERGARGYVCAWCGFEVIAKQGASLSWHFAHSSGLRERECSACFQGGESEWHKLAKTVIQTAGGLHYRIDADKWTVTTGRVYLENERSRFIDCLNAGFLPDALLEDWNGNDLLIELRWSNPVSALKRARIVAHGVPCLELDIRGVERMRRIEDQRALVCTTGPREWIVAPTW
jgi:Competence protein CoiA-like family